MSDCRRSRGAVHVVRSAVLGGEAADGLGRSATPSSVVAGGLVDGANELLVGQVSQPLKAFERQSTAFSKEICSKFAIHRSGCGKVIERFTGLNQDEHRRRHRAQDSRGGGRGRRRGRERERC